MVVEGAGAFEPPSLQFAFGPYPTKSRTVGPRGQEPLSEAVLATSATLPFVLAMSMAPLRSGVGSVRPLTPLEEGWIRK